MLDLLVHVQSSLRLELLLAVAAFMVLLASGLMDCLVLVEGRIFRKLFVTALHVASKRFFPRMDSGVVLVVG